jgi:hypothetical protein
MPNRKKARKKALTKEQKLKEMREQREITRELESELKELDAKIQRLKKSQMGVVRII